MAETPLSTPKRKHAELLNDYVSNLNTTTASFTFDPHTPVKDGSASPRTNVAVRFRGLALGGGGGVDDRSSRSPEPRGFGLDQADGGSRKRARLPDVDMTDVQTANLPATGVRFAGVAAASDPTPRAGPQQPQPVQSSSTQRKAGSRSPRQQSPKAVKFAVDTAVTEQSETVATSPRTSSPPRGRPRAGTPPLSHSTGSTGKTTPAELDERLISDPLRASLTWHDDEITVYDPDDSDDDGTGINGIGFKPTPAIAYARTVKRKQQLAEYRKREEREARAKRSQRRRGSPVPGLVELKGTVERRRVRFMESATELISF
ncbi:hypothetical protein OQA88_9923 [Cercophora sp. LCS_1]